MIVIQMCNSKPISDDAFSTGKDQAHEPPKGSVSVWIPLIDSDITKNVSFRLLTVDEKFYFMAFTTIKGGQEFLKFDEQPFYVMSSAAAIDMFIAAMKEDPNIAGYVFDPGTSKQIDKQRNELLESVEISVSDILSFGPLAEVAPAGMLAEFSSALQNAGIQGAKGIFLLQNNMRRTWIVAIPTSDQNIIANIWQTLDKILRKSSDDISKLPDLIIGDLRGDTLAEQNGSPL